MDQAITVAERLFLKGTVYRCQAYRGTARRLDTLTRLELVTTGPRNPDGSPPMATFFRDLLLFFEHEFEGTWRARLQDVVAYQDIVRDPTDVVCCARIRWSGDDQVWPHHE